MRRLVLNAISDDFENVDHVILRDVAKTDDTWYPLDDEGNLKPDWRLDPA